MKNYGSRLKKIEDKINIKKEVILFSSSGLYNPAELEGLQKEGMIVEEDDKKVVIKIGDRVKEHGVYI